MRHGRLFFTHMPVYSSQVWKAEGSTQQVVLFLSRLARRWLRLLPHAKESLQLSASSYCVRSGGLGRQWQILGNSLFRERATGITCPWDSKSEGSFQTHVLVPFFFHVIKVMLSRLGAHTFLLKTVLPSGLTMQGAEHA